MKTERDLGAMISFDPLVKTTKLKILKIDLGVFNGPGLSSPTDYDSHKDIIGRIALKPQTIAKNVTLGVAASLLAGGLNPNTKYIYTTQTMGGNKILWLILRQATSVKFPQENITELMPN